MTDKLIEELIKVLSDLGIVITTKTYKIKEFIEESFTSKEEYESEIRKLNEEFRTFLERLKLECDIGKCDCGEKLRDWDIALLIQDRLNEYLPVKKIT